MTSKQVLSDDMWGGGGGGIGRGSVVYNNS